MADRIPEQPHVQSLRHPLVVQARRLLDSPRRRREAMGFVVDGARLIRDAIEAGMVPEVLFVETGRLRAPADQPGAAHRMVEDLVEQVQARGGRVVWCGPRVVAALSAAEHPQGVVAVMRFGPGGPPRWPASATLLVLGDGLQDPGNVGTLVRSACGAGADGVVLSSDSADPYGPKALRASAGAVFRLPVRRLEGDDSLAEEARRLRQSGWRVMALAAHEGLSYDAADLTGRVAVAVGAEAHGLRAAVRAACDGALTVPLACGLESLNAAVAAAVVLFEAARQRRAASRAGGL